MKNELIYWIALTQLKNWKLERINRLIVKIINEQKSSLDEFFNQTIVCLQSIDCLEKSDLNRIYELEEKEIQAIESVKKELPQYSFLTEDLLAQGYQIITFDSPLYSKTLKENLKLNRSPTILYVKGNNQLLQENSIAIVGSRDADEISLSFTDNVARRASKEFKVVVSGFAKGVDRQALVSALKYKGQSIIVLPQGIMTFSAGLNKYYKEIVQGDLLVLSTFFPKAPWSVQLAMARNPIIYGLAQQIYVAQSSEQGGTWAGVTDGLRKGREIFVRKPGSDEKSANDLLIQQGAKPVDVNGHVLLPEIVDDTAGIPTSKDIKEGILLEQIYEILKTGEFTSSDLIKKAGLDINPNKLTHLLKKQKDINISKGKPFKFTLSTNQPSSLFNNDNTLEPKQDIVATQKDRYNNEVG